MGQALMRFLLMLLPALFCPPTLDLCSLNRSQMGIKLDSHNKGTVLDGLGKGNRDWMLVALVRIGYLPA